MQLMGKYCKAYPIEVLRRFERWSERGDNARSPESVGADGRFVEEAFLFLQENLVVTDGIIKNQHVIFESRSPEWRQFCESVLEFPRESILVDVEDATREAVNQ